MQIAYELTQQDFKDAYAAHRNRTSWRRWIRRIVLLIAGLTVALILFGFLIKPSAEAAKNVTPFFGLVLMWIVLLWFYPRWAMARQFTKQPGAHGPKTVMFDSVGAHWRWNGGSSDIEWKNYVRLVEGKTLFLLYTSPACFNILPKRALEQAELSRLRDFLAQNICSPKHLRTQAHSG